MTILNTGRARQLSSITNTNQGGGPKKAGLPGTMGNSAWKTIHLRQTSQTFDVLRFPLVSTVVQSRPASVPVHLHVKEFKL